MLVALTQFITVRVQGEGLPVATRGFDGSCEPLPLFCVDGRLATAQWRTLLGVMQRTILHVGRKRGDRLGFLSRRVHPFK